MSFRKLFLAGVSLVSTAFGKGFEAEPARVLCQQEGEFIGWPSIIALDDGRLMAVFSGGRQFHVDPYGKIFGVWSEDQGATWSCPRLLQDGPLDDRDPGLLQLPNGDILLSYFTSVIFADYEEAMREEYGDAVDGWAPAIEAATEEVRKKHLGRFVKLQKRGEQRWSEPRRVHVLAPHGPTLLTNGDILFLGTYRGKVYAERSQDGGENWELLGTVPSPEGTLSKQFSEPHVVEVSEGKLLGVMRFLHPDPQKRFLYQTESEDGGLTWSTAYSTGLLGYPGHLLKRTNGQVILSYGRREAPMGQRVVMTSDGGKTWSREYSLCSSPDPDMGYPATAQLGDGRFFTVFYQSATAGEKPSLMGLSWRIR